MGLFKKKNGSSTGFAKVLKGIGKVVTVAAPFIPVPGSGVIGKALAKISDKTGIPLSKAAPEKNETLGDFVSRVEKGLGGAAAGFTDQVADAPSNIANPAVQGFANEKVQNKLPWILGGIAALLLVFRKKIFN